ncbi:DUF2490 domain-containing protein [Arcicella sp. BE51]|uniref:DUF2490 domain-containing protein n=2 Tax=Arcicella TaxID=217140 RepID=UPI00286C57EA|nr:DUF2490 domain-containing protein [Arcicella sp. BE51]
MKNTQLYILCLCLMSTLIHGQSTKDYNDFQTWYGASIKLDLPKRWSVSGQYRMRLADDASNYKGSYVYGQLDKRLSNTFEITSSYRLAMVDKGTYHRYALGIEAQKEIGRFRASIRPMIQYQKQYFVGDDEQSDTDAFLRTRFTGKYKLTRRLDVYAYTEPFVELDNSLAFDRFRNSAGLKYEVNKSFKVNLYYLWVPDYSHKQLRTNHIAGLDLEFTLKPWKKKKRIISVDE